MSSTQQAPERLAFTYGEAAATGSVSKAMIMKLVRTGQLEAVRIGRVVRIPRRALLELFGVRQ